MFALGETPYTKVFVRNEFLFDECKGHGEFTPAPNKEWQTPSKVYSVER